jgi:hypothetical protein
LVIATAMLPAAAAQGEELHADVARLFDLGKNNTQAAIAAARDQNAQLKRTTPNDPRIDYAYGVVLLNQRRYREALPLISGYAEAQRSDLVASAVKARVLIENRRNADALSAAVAIAARFPNDRSAKTDDELHDVARLLGQLLGFLSVRSSAAEAEPRVQATNQILARLGEAHIAAFDEGRRQVTEQFDQLRQQRQTRLDQRAQDAADHKGQLEAAADQSREQAATNLKTLDASGEAWQEARRELTLLEQQAALLVRERYLLAAQVAALENQLTALVAPVSRTETRERVIGRNPTQERITQSTSQAINFDRYVQAQNVAYSLAVLKKQAFDMDRRLLSIQSRAAQVVGHGTRQMESLATSEAALREAKRRTASLETQARRLQARQSTPPRTVTAEMQQLSTYLPSAYDEESKRVLAWFDK